MFVKDEHPIRNIIIGFACYYILLFLVAFYPATVMMAKFGSLTESRGMWKGFFAFIITLFIMVVAAGLAFSKGVPDSLKVIGWIVIVGLYVVCLCPFISIVGQIDSPTYPKYGTSDVTDYNSEPLPIKVNFVYEGFWRDFFTWDSKLMWDISKGPILTVLVVLPLRLIFGFGKKTKNNSRLQKKYSHK